MAHVMAQPLLLVYLGVGTIQIILLCGADGPTITAAFRRDLRTLRRRGSLALVAGGPIWLAGAILAWPVVATCEAITWRDRLAGRS